MNRKRLVLIVLLGVLAVAMFYAYWATPRQERVTSPRPVKAPRPVTVKADGKPLPATGGRVLVGQLDVEKTAFPGAKRDIFSYHVRRAPAPPPPPVVEAPPPPPPVIAQPVMPTPPPNVMQRALARFTFLGFMVKGGEKTVFLSSGEDIFLAKRGGAFGKNKEFRVEDLTEGELIVSRDGQPGTMTVSLVVNEKLTPAISTPAKSLGGIGSAPAPARPVFQSPTGTLQRRGPVRFRPPTPTPTGAETTPESEQEPFEETYQEPPEPGEPVEGGADGSNQ